MACAAAGYTEDIQYIQTIRTYCSRSGGSLQPLLFHVGFRGHWMVRVCTSGLKPTFHTDGTGYPSQGLPAPVGKGPPKAWISRILSEDSAQGACHFWWFGPELIKQCSARGCTRVVHVTHCLHPCCASKHTLLTGGRVRWNVKDKHIPFGHAVQTCAPFVHERCMDAHCAMDCLRRTHCGKCTITMTIDVGTVIYDELPTLTVTIGT